MHTLQPLEVIVILITPGPPRPYGEICLALVAHGVVKAWVDNVVDGRPRHSGRPQGAVAMSETILVSSQFHPPE